MNDLYYKKKYKKYKRKYLGGARFLPKETMSHILSYQPRFNLGESLWRKMNKPDGFKIKDLIRLLVKKRKDKGVIHFLEMAGLTNCTTMGSFTTGIDGCGNPFVILLRAVGIESHNTTYYKYDFDRLLEYVKTRYQQQQEEQQQEDDV